MDAQGGWMEERSKIERKIEKRRMDGRKEKDKGEEN